jgi:hypothetical protein
MKKAEGELKMKVNETSKRRIAAITMVLFSIAMFLGVPGEAVAAKDTCCPDNQCTAASLCYDNGWCQGTNLCRATGGNSCYWQQGC